MFKVNPGAELTTQLLYKIINKFRLEDMPRLQKRKDYYDGIQQILQKSYSDASKPCNRTVTNFCQNITDSYCGYIASPGYISYGSEEDIEPIMDVLRYNDYQTEDSTLLQQALIYGVAAELMYIDIDAKVRFKLIDPTTCFGIHDDTLSNDLLYFVRMYKADEWDESNDYIVDVYTNSKIITYKMLGPNGGLTFVCEQPHYFKQCPANIFYLPDERSIFDCIVSLQDSYNELLTSEIDDYSAFVDAFLAISGCDADSEDIAAMKENRVLVLPEGAQAAWLTKNASDTQIENQLKRINDNIYKIAACPDFSSESFVGGVSSGVAIRYRLTGMETRAAKVAALMKKALQRRIEIICGIATLKLGEEVFKDVTITFKRNIPVDEQSMAAVINSYRGLVSDETLLSMIPQIESVSDEIEKVQAQKSETMALYSFGVDE